MTPMKHPRDPSRSDDADTLAADTASAPALAQTLEASASLGPVTHEATMADTGFADRYVTRRLLGSGGMGEVRASKDQRIGREVAMKVIRQGETTGGEDRARFLREARIQGQLEHPAVVPVYDVGLDPDGTEYFTMKRISGVTLGEAIHSTTKDEKDERSRFTAHKLLAAFLQICLCIDYAHTRGVLHRDLKPANIMLGDFGEVYVLDWGIAKLDDDVDEKPVESVRVDTGQVAHTPTLAGQVFGTPGYMPPERIAGDSADGRSDVYALGAILFEILTGERLHIGKSVDELIESTTRGANARASLRAPSRDVPPELEAVCVRATESDPERRFQGVRELHDAVERYLEGDRDLELRRELAETHAQQASKAAAMAFETDDADGGHRSKALGEVGRSLALDTHNRRAQQTLAALLTRPPDEPPPAAKIEIERRSAHEVRSAARIAAWSIIAIASFAALMTLDRAAVADVLPMIVPAAIASALCFVVGYGKRSAGPLPLVIVLLMCAAIAASTGFMGPLVVTPGLALAIAIVAFGLGRGEVYRGVVVAASVLTVLAPALLEITGVIASTYRNEGGGILIVPRLFTVPDRSYPIAVLIACVITIIVPALFAWGLTKRHSDLGDRLHVFKWQFGQLVPKDAQVDVDPHGAAVSHRNEATPKA